MNERTKKKRVNKHQSARVTIGFLNQHPGDEYNAAMWAGANDAAQEYEANLLYFSGGILHDPEGFASQANMLYDLVDTERLDGVLIWGALMAHHTTLEEVNAFCARYRPLPIVSVGLAIEGIPCLLVDNYQGMHDVVTHLIEAHAHRQIAYICGPAESAESRDRYRGYATALAERGIPLDPSLVVTGNDLKNAFGQGHAAVGDVSIRLLLEQRKLRPGADFTALVGHDDNASRWALHALQARGIRVPADVALASFDDVRFAQYLMPPLTTARQSFYDQGYHGAKMLFARLRGEALPAQMTLSVEVVVRQSCGCVDPIVAAAQATNDLSPMRRAKQIQLRTGLAEKRETILAEMVRRVGNEETGSRWAEQVWESFLAEMEKPLSGTFLRVMDDVLRQVLEAGGGQISGGQALAAWQWALSALRQGVQPYIDAEALARAENLWQQARVLIGEMARRADAYQVLLAEQRTITLQEIGAALITTFDVQELMNALAEGLPRLGIPSAYLSLYEDPQPYAYPRPAPVWSRLMLAYSANGRIALDMQGQRFRSRELCPPELLPQEWQGSFVIEPLYFNMQQIGFIVFEVGPREGIVYDTLRKQISSALQGALLMNDITKKNYILDTFMANVPDSIYFKDRESRFTRCNAAVAKLLEENDPDELIGKTDFDFFPPAQAQPKYEQEQTIMRTGHPILNFEEPNIHNRWALTTKMPLRDEHGTIIGTFGISHDITDLKHVQHKLAAAYEEIRLMNMQLTKENRRMGAELHVARQLQQMMLPKPSELQQCEGVETVGYMQPADEVGGDYYDVLREHDILHIGIGDVTGHGLESGILMVMVQTAIRALIEHGETDPVKFVTTLNRTIYKNARRMGMEKSLTFAIANYRKGRLKIAGQHEEILIVRKNGHIEKLNTMGLGFPLGLEAEISQWVHEATICLEPEEGFVLYTDGITEAENVEHSLYGLPRLCQVVSRHWHLGADAIKQAVVDDVLAFVGTHKIYDDITLIVLKQQ